MGIEERNTRAHTHTRAHARTHREAEDRHLDNTRQKWRQEIQYKTVKGLVRPFCSWGFILFYLMLYFAVFGIGLPNSTARENSSAHAGTWALRELRRVGRIVANTCKGRNAKEEQSWHRAVYWFIYTAAELLLERLGLLCLQTDSVFTF